MEVNRTIDPDRHAVYTTVTGEITMDDIQADIARLATEPEYSPDMPGLVDLRQATARLTTDDLKQLAEKIEKSPRTVARTRRALLVASERLFDIYSKFVQLTAGGRVEYKVFRDEQAARDWVDEAIDNRRLRFI